MDAPQSIEAVGTTIEDAIARGLEALNAERREVDIEVMLAERGREARVRLTRKANYDPVPASPGPAPAPIEPAAPVATPDAAITDDGEVAQRVLSELLTKMHVPATVQARLAQEVLDPKADGPTLILDIRGDDVSNLIGRRGETLENLQYLTRLLVTKQLGHFVNLVLDVEGYKSHREQSLQQLAQRMAERVMQTRKPAALEPMPANERRIIHLTLRDHPHVRTESVGTGENRKITIVPKTAKR